uniref:Os07g0694800 protein, related n=1 Tax=Neospora caninum (strain Liverpool) TaxID=572307 RepID=A0A0F7UIP9_NEOCL|nr:TPA: Os07g0694800 protein, related [Neospora caninum Liverpool]
MAKARDLAAGAPYQRMADPKGYTLNQVAVGDTDRECFFSDTGRYSTHKKPIRSAQKRADIQTSIRDRSEALADPAGTVWACCLGTEIYFADLLKSLKKSENLGTSLIKIENTYSEVFFCHCFPQKKTCFIFRFGCIVAWDVDKDQREELIRLMEPFVKESLGSKREDDTMSYVWSERATIKADHIHLVTPNVFERLAYSYAFAQSVKLAVFETVVDETIERTRKIPEGLAKSGKINSTREDISKRIGELFVNRFYINLHTDILDTPDIFWDNDDFADHYDNCRRYLEIPKRVDILNQRLDIIKDLYDMLNDELTNQHGNKLEWIVIYLICIEVLIDVVWNILIKDILKWV